MELTFRYRFSLVFSPISWATVSEVAATFLVVFHNGFAYSSIGHIFINFNENMCYCFLKLLLGAKVRTTAA
jgi:hypothetical protein